MTHIRVVGSLSSHQRHTTGTANSDRGIVVRKGGAFGHKMLLQCGHVVQGSMVEILIVGEDEDDVRASCWSRIGHTVGT